MKQLRVMIYGRTGMKNSVVAFYRKSLIGTEMSPAHITLWDAAIIMDMMG